MNEASVCDMGSTVIAIYLKILKKRANSQISVAGKTSIYWEIFFMTRWPSG